MTRRLMACVLVTACSFVLTTSTFAQGGFWADSATIGNRGAPDPGEQTVLTFFGSGTGSTAADAVAAAMSDAHENSAAGVAVFGQTHNVFSVVTIYDGLFDLVEFPPVYPADGGDPIRTWFAIWKTQVDVLHFD